ncbi:MAG: tail fiber domain-containing protein [Gemmatimonadota bacterium]
MDAASIQASAVTDAKLASAPATAASANSLAKRDGSGGLTATTVTAADFASSSSNLYLANAGAAESNTIRIGTGHTRAFVAGVSGVAPAGGTAPVLVDTNGQLGTIPSTAATKRDIRTIDAELDRLALLRPVSFRYRADPAGEMQFGLVAEEVEEVFPELALYGGDGRLTSVRYHLLAPLVLAQAQRNRIRAAELEADLAASLERVAALEARLATMEAATADPHADGERR